MPPSVREPDFPLDVKHTRPSEPTQGDPRGTTIVVLPDTQYYVACRSDHLKNQVRFVEQAIQRRNIAAVFTLGDLTDHNYPEEWSFFRESLGPLPQHVPLVLVTGNHDHGDAGAANRRGSLFSQYFDPQIVQPKRLLVATQREGDLENAYYRFPFRRANDGSIRVCSEDCRPAFTLGVLALGWSPTAATVRWALETLARYPGDRRILLTHAYLYHDGSRYDFRRHGEKQKWNPLAYGTKGPDPERREGFDGEMLWNELVSIDPGFFLTLNGHVLGSGAARLTSTGQHLNQVHQVLVNYQMLREGGLGYLRLLELASDGRSLSMKTYSPSKDRHSVATDQSFTLEIKPPLF